MPRTRFSTAAKASLPPGSMVHIGRRLIETPQITLIDYGPKHFKCLPSVAPEQCLPPEDSGIVRWINVQGLHDATLIETIGHNFNLHPLLLEDVINTGQRPKLEDYAGLLFVVLKGLSLNGNQPEAEQLSLIVGANFVITFEEGPPEAFKALRERLEKAAGRLRHLGSDYLCYALMDCIVDEYFKVIHNLEERLDLAEESLLTRPDRLTINQIYQLRSAETFVRRQIAPLGDVVAALRHGESEIITQDSAVYLRDLADHVTRINENLEMLRTMTGTMLETYLSIQSMRTGEIMRVLTIFSTIFIPLTFVVGLYGMNFDYMPELHYRFAYPILLIAMGSMATGMLIFFKRKKWLWPSGGKR